MKFKLSKTKSTISKLKADEKDFLKTGVDYSGTKWSFSDGVTPGTVRITKESGDKSFYYQRETFKKNITLHATVGTLSTDVANLSKTDHHVSTPYLIARDGTILELFDPKYWSYHIGSSPRGAGWSNTTLSKTSIGIEMSNFVMLKEHETNKKLLTDYWGFAYCKKTDAEYYKEVDYRGFKYYATFTDEQYKSLDSLLLNLCRKFNISHSFLPRDSRFNFTKNVPKSGIWVHSNVRSDKYDLNPAFDFGRISGR